MASHASGDEFRSVFRNDADVREEAPGRVNLMGDHTDYHQGLVLPTVLPQRTTVELRLRSDRIVHVFSTSVGGEVQHYRLGEETPSRGWIDYVQGVTEALTQAGHRLSGFDALISSTVPIGAGVSSSAALEVALLRALRTATRLCIEDVELARIAQRAEAGFVGAPVGIMDQMVCSLGHPDEALFLDTRTISYQHVPLPTRSDLVVIDSGVAHAHARGEYAQRRRESFEAAAALGVEWLRDATPEMLAAARIGDETLARRARHVIAENQRVLAAVAAMRSDDPAWLGRLFDRSHASMRDDYETSTAEVDALVQAGHEDGDVYGARLTGGGFGGAVVMLARHGCGAAVARRVSATYESRTARQASILLPADIALH
jgi:galactokinase